MFAFDAKLGAELSRGLNTLLTGAAVGVGIVAARSPSRCQF